MAKKKEKVKDSVSEKRYLVFLDGSKYEIIAERGKYYICDGTQFRKGNPRIKEVV